MKLAILAKAAVAALTDEDLRKRLGWVVVAILSPLILLIAFLCSLAAGAAEHNNATVDLVFSGGAIPSAATAEYAAQVRAMQDCLSVLDGAIADINAQIESGTLDSALIASTFYVLHFNDENLSLTPEEARTFADCFARYETHTRRVESGTDPDTGETLYVEETYTVAFSVSRTQAYSKLAALGYPDLAAWSQNASAVYQRIAYGTGGSYSGAIEHTGAQTTDLNIAFSDPSTKNAADLAAYAKHAWQSGWGYVWGTFGNVLTPSAFTAKLRQYPDGVGKYADFIQANWVGSRTADCVGLIKGYGWLNPSTSAIEYGTKGMPDVSADGMYKSAAVKGPIRTMPDKPGIAVWHSGHIGVYIGNGDVIEAMGTKYGVVKTKLSERSWTHWLEVPSIRYD